MAIATASASNVSGAKVRHNPTAAFRPYDWLALPVVSPGDQKLVGLYAVFNHDQNWVGFTVSGAYTVDWGDGTVENFATGATCSHQYTWANIDAATTTSLGYRQAIITITPQAGQTLTSMSLVSRPVGAVAMSTGWLDIRLAGSSISSMTVSANTPAVWHRMLLQFELVGTTTGTWSAPYLFNGCSSLVSVVGAIKTSSGISVFANCSSLVNISGFQLSAAATSCATMFIGCSSLPAAPTLTTQNVTDFTSMFSGCFSLTTVPLYNTVKAITMTNMFANCYSLTSVPAFNTSVCTAMNSMFTGCVSLAVAPALDTHLNQSFSTMFNGCTNLTSVPTYDMTACTTASSMFAGCTRLTTVPLFPMSTAAGNNNFVSMFNGCASLQTLPAIDMAGGTGTGALGSLLTGCASLSASALLNMHLPVTYSNLRLSAAALNAIYTALATTANGYAVTVSGNYGIAGDDPTIATAKGWTVTGS